MDRQTLIAMLESVRKNNMLGPKIGDELEISELLDFALSKGLIQRAHNGNFVITIKGINLLEEKLSWESL